MIRGKHFGAVILAAGESRRMGRPKSSLIDGSGKTFISKLVELYCELGCAHITVIANPDNALDILVSLEQKSVPRVKVIVNKRQDLGRIYSIQLGVKRLLNGSEFCFIQDVDRPSVSLDALQQLGGLGKNGFWSFLKYQNRKGHPVLISKEIMEYIIQCNTQTEILSDVLSLFPSKGAPTTDKAILMNLNTKEDYEKHFGTSELEHKYL